MTETHFPIPGIQNGQKKVKRLSSPNLVLLKLTCVCLWYEVQALRNTCLMEACSFWSRAVLIPTAEKDEDALAGIEMVNGFAHFVGPVNCLLECVI